MLHSSIILHSFVLTIKRTKKSMTHREVLIGKKERNHEHREYTKPDAEGDIRVLHSLHYQKGWGLPEWYSGRNESSQPAHIRRNPISIAHKAKKFWHAHLPVGRKQLGTSAQILLPNANRGGILPGTPADLAGAIERSKCINKLNSY